MDWYSLFTIRNFRAIQIVEKEKILHRDCHDLGRRTGRKLTSEVQPLDYHRWLDRTHLLHQTRRGRTILNRKT